MPYANEKLSDGAILMILIDNMDAVGEGYVVNFPEIGEQERHVEWYKGEFTSMFPEATVNNGLKLFDTTTDLIRLPVFSTTSNFYSAAALAESPSISTESLEAKAWIKDHKAMIEKSLERGARRWSVHGTAIITAEDGFIRALDYDDNAIYLRVGERDRPDTLVGHVLLYPFYMPQEEGEELVHNVNVPNRIRVEKFFGDNGTLQTFHFDGHTIGVPVEGDAGRLSASPITAFCVAGDGDTWYSRLDSIGSMLLIMISNIHGTIMRFENRPVYLPVRVYNMMREELERIQRMMQDAGNTDEEEPIITLQQVAQAFDKLVRPRMGIDNEEEPPMGSAETLELVTQFEALRSYQDYFYLGSGLPPASYGIGVGRGESGIARERAQDAAATRIRAFRRDLSECLPNLVAGAGMPAADISFNWITSPFEDRSKKQEEVIALKNAGIINERQAAEMMGIEFEGPLNPEPTTSESDNNDTPEGEEVEE